MDEAFSRSDETNSRYAMELFETLGLQLLVVTPLNGIHIVEPYVNVCHYVVNSNDEGNSRVWDMTMSELKRKRAAAQAHVDPGRNRGQGQAKISVSIYRVA